MIRGPIEEKLKQKTIGRQTMRDFLEKILKIEEAGKQYTAEYKSGIKSAVSKEEQMEE